MLDSPATIDSMTEAKASQSWPTLLVCLQNYFNFQYLPLPESRTNTKAASIAVFMNSTVDDENYEH